MSYIDHNQKIIFIHNPKCAGNSLRRYLGFNNKETYHNIPSEIDAKVWEQYTTITSIRHPIYRLISSWKYHTNPEYRGFYSERVYNLHQLNIELYFYYFKHTKTILPNIKYTQHNKSNKSIDIILEFEKLHDTTYLKEKLKHIQTSDVLPNINKTIYRPQEHIETIKNNNKLLADIIKFYQEDFETFNYEI